MLITRPKHRVDHGNSQARALHDLHMDLAIGCLNDLMEHRHQRCLVIKGRDLAAAREFKLWQEEPLTVAIQTRAAIPEYLQGKLSRDWESTAHGEMLKRQSVGKFLILVFCGNIVITIYCNCGTTVIVSHQDSPS